MFKSWLSKLEKKITHLSGTDYAPRLFSFEQLLVLVSRLYGVGAGLRLSLYRSGLLKQKKLPCFVISIGNITAGGAGKTPMAVYLADTLIGLGYKPVVVSRGYKRVSGKSLCIVGDGRNVFMDAAGAGDEPFMMARQKRFPVVVGKNRYEAGRMALKELDVNVVILDDGFQHMGLARDMDLVLFDHNRPLGNERVLPAGRLREIPAMAGERIHGIILTRCPESENDSNRKPELPAALGRYFHGIPFFCTRHQPFLSEYYSRGHETGVPDNITCLKNCRAVLFSGIARNASFRDTVRRLGVKVAAHLEFSDHYRYKRSDFIDIRNQARELDVDIILTTEKDWVKVARSFDWELDIGVIGIRIGFDDINALIELIESKCIR